MSMNIDFERYTYYIRPGITDMRKGAHALAYIVQNEMKLDAFSPSVFLFCGGGKRIIKILLWDTNGWYEISKRIETHERFSWPMDNEEARSVSLDDVMAFLRGQNPWTRFSPIFPSRV